MTTDHRDELIATQRKLIESQEVTIQTLRNLVAQLQKMVQDAKGPRKDVQA